MDRWNQAVNTCSRSPAVSRFDFSLQSTKQFRCPCQKHWLHSIATRGHTTSKEGQHCKLHCMGTLFFRRTSVLCPSPPVRVRASSGEGDESGYPRHQLLWGAALLCCSALSGHLFSLGHSGGTKKCFLPLPAKQLWLLLSPVGKTTSVPKICSPATLGGCCPGCQASENVYSSSAGLMGFASLFPHSSLVTSYLV